MTVLRLVLVLVLLTACAGPAAKPPPVLPAGGPTAPDPGGSVRSFELTAAPAEITLKPGVTVHAWAYNGQVPGPAIRVRAGDLVRVTLRNRLPGGTTVHWHGLQVPNGEDGVAGVTQDAAPAGSTTTYSFVPRVPGTYWYHSHEHGAAQVDRGLYGPLIVEPASGSSGASGAALQDATLVYDEWPLGLSMPKVPPAGDFNLVSYTTYSVNGKADQAIAPVRFQPGVPLRLRLVNAGYAVHLVHVDGASAAVVALDGHDVSGGPPTSDSIPIGPAERVDLLLTPPDRQLSLSLEDGMLPAEHTVVPLVPAELQPAPVSSPAAPHPVLDLWTYPASAPAAVWPAGAAATKNFTLTLDTAPLASVPEMAGMKGMNTTGGLAYTINGRAFPGTAALDVSQGDLVQLTFQNRSRYDHTMHLHGHVLQVLSVNGRAPAGVLLKDTVLVPAGDSVSVGFRADNPGWWMLHCHQLYHSLGGMMALVRYDGSARPAQLGGAYDSRPE